MLCYAAMGMVLPTESTNYGTRMRTELCCFMLKRPFEEVCEGFCIGLFGDFFLAAIFRHRLTRPNFITHDVTR